MWWCWLKIKVGTLCFCMDFCRLNMHTKKDSYLLPQVQETLESMVDVMHFSTMDFKSGFWQVKMVPESQQHTALTMENLGIYKFTHMSFGFCNALVTFQCLMQNTLGQMNLTYCIIYLDDVIVFGCTEDEHLEHLHIVFEWFCEFNLKLEPSKYSFSNQRLCTWCIMFPMRGFALVKKMYVWWRSYQCQKPSLGFVCFADWWGNISRELLTSRGPSMMY